MSYHVKNVYVLADTASKMHYSELFRLPVIESQLTLP